MCLVIRFFMIHFSSCIVSTYRWKQVDLLDLQDQVKEESTLVGSFIFSGIKTVDFWDLIILMEIKKSTLLAGTFVQ